MPLKQCKNCGKVFNSTGMGSGLHLYCSVKCKEIVCLICNKRFIPDKRSPLRKYCSNTCRGFGVPIGKFIGQVCKKICIECGSFFIVSGDKPNFTHQLKQKCCSRLCANRHSGRASRISEETESVDREGSPIIRRNRKWVKKWITVLETVFKRALTHQELQCTRFIDGNPKNHQLSNLVIIPGKNTLRVCQVCGNAKVISKHDFQKFHGLCWSCHNNSSVGRERRSIWIKNACKKRQRNGL